MYVVECSDGTLYCGITNSLDIRMKTHNLGKGAKYTRSRLPVRLRAFWPHEDRSTASKAEYAFKQLSRAEKLRRIEENNG